MLIASITTFLIIICSKYEDNETSPIWFFILLSAMILPTIIIVILEKHIEKKKQTKEYREMELKNSKEIIEKNIS